MHLVLILDSTNHLGAEVRIFAALRDYGDLTALEKMDRLWSRLAGFGAIMNDQGKSGFQPVTELAIYGLNGKCAAP